MGAARNRHGQGCDQGSRSDVSGTDRRNPQGKSEKHDRYQARVSSTDRQAARTT